VTTRAPDEAKTVAITRTRRCPVCGAKYPAEFLVCPKDATSLEGAELTEDDPMSTTRYVYAKPGTRSESSKLFEEVVPIVLKRPAAPSVER